MKITLSTLSPTNSLGKKISATPKGVANFWRWFGKSKVVDSKYRPLVVYHGTTAKFTEFKTTDDGGFHFGDKAAAAWRLADLTGYEDAPGNIVMSVYLSIQNPLIIGHDPGTVVEWNRVIRAAKAAGHDGISYLNNTEIDEDEDLARQPTRSWVAFLPQQIKSVKNSGAFQKSSKDIHV